jgi:hypothetical protein
MRESYRNSGFRDARCEESLRTLFALTIALVAASAAAGDFSARDVPSAHIRQAGRIEIRNDARGVTAYHFFGDIRQALFTLRSGPRALHYTRCSTLERV